MINLGNKDEIFGAEHLQPLEIDGRPTSMPPLRGDEAVICGYNQGLDEQMLVCENLQDMQELYDAYALGGALNIHWYRGANVGFAGSTRA